MQNNLDKILADLYESDPSLRQHDATLRKLVVELLELRPNAQMDESFRQDLRRRLMALAESNVSKPSLTTIFMKNFQFVGAGVAMFALLVAGAWYLNGVSNPQSLTAMLAAPKISKAGDNAFGSLASLTSAGRGQGGGGNASLSAAPESAGSGGGGDIAVDQKMIAPNPVTFRYIYTGEDLVLAQEQVDVLKRIKNEGNGGFSDLFGRISLGLADLGSFSKTKMQSFSFVEDRDRGYMVTVQLNEGSIYIGENWEKWLSLTCPAMSSESSSVVCPEPRRLDPEDVPADDVIISAANSFLDAHGIPRSNYGQPQVNNQWRVQYELAQDKSQIWIPDVASVIYPLVLDGQEVHDESGNLSGMNVSVRVSPEISVSGVYDLTTQNYESSSYRAETDVARIMDILSKGGFRNYYYTEPGAKVVDVEIGTPEVTLVKLWNYKNGLNEELLVPSLVFPVTKAPTAEEVGPYGWYRTNLVIPLVKEILDNENGFDRIMPMGSTEPGVSEEAPAPATVPTDLAQ